MPAPPPSILLIRRRYLGDVVLLGSVIRNLRLHWPGARLTALVEAPFAGVLALNPDLDGALVLPQRPTAWPDFLRRLRRLRATQVLDFDNSERTALLAWLSGAPLRATVWHEGRRPRLDRCYTHRQFDPPAIHETRPITEYFLSLLGAVGVPVVDRSIRLVPRESDVAAAVVLLEHSGAGPAARTLLVHPGSRSPFRLWPAERFAEVCRQLRADPGVRIVLVAGPDETELLRRIGAAAGAGVGVIEPPLTVPQFAALATCCDLLLCHDSGPMHVAAAVGTRVVALLGSQNPVLFAPPGAGHTQLRPPDPCVTCVAPGLCVPGDSYRNYCVRNLAVETVVAAVRAQLDGVAAEP